MVWRIVPESRVADAFSGEGARLFGGRWNSKGQRAVYTSGSRALAALEILVHLSAATAGRRYRIIGLDIPEDMIETLTPKRLPSDWMSPMIPLSTRRIGDEWLRSRAKVALRVPSAVIPEESNYLLNPAHDNLARHRPSADTVFTFDPRLHPAR